MTDTFDIQHLKQTSCNTFITIARSIDAGTTHNTELDLIEMLAVLQHVIVDRFNKPNITYGGVTLVPSTHFEEHRNDADNNYRSLNISVRQHAADTIRQTFKHPTTGRSGPIVQRVVTVGLDSVFNIITHIHPTERAAIVSGLMTDIIANINKLGVIDTADAQLAANDVTSLIKARSAKRTPTKAQRLAMIESAALKLQDDISQDDDTAHKYAT